jgi:hypothetical protein
MAFPKIIKGLGRHAALLAFLAVPVGVVAGQGCTLAQEYCDVFCECERCNDRQADDCELAVQAAVDIADEYDCTAESDEYLECARLDNDCDDNNFTVDDGCNGELEDLADCLDDNSDILNFGSVNVAQGQGPTDAVQQQAQGGGQTFCACSCTCTMCTIESETRTCEAGQGGCESCDVVCTDACLADAMCGSLDTALGECVQGQ